MESKQRKRKLTKKQMRRIRQRNRRILFGCMGVVIVVLVAILFITKGKDSEDKTGQNVAGENIEGTVTDTPTPTPTDEPSPTPTSDPVPAVSLENIDSKSAVLVRRYDNQVVCEKEADIVLYPASMTKMMTALVAIENISNLNDTLKISQSTYDKMYLAGASLAGYPCGESIPVIDVLYGIMLPSGAECCVGIAEYLYGSEEAFVQKMNAKAEELGMTSTHFMNSTGLHDDQHYTTVKDLTKLVQYALENETFRMIYCSQKYTTTPTEDNPAGITLYNSMFSKMSSNAINGGEILGGKTGFTDNAGYCLASLAQVNGEEYILITAGATSATKTGHIEDAFLIYNQIAQTE